MSIISNWDDVEKLLHHAFYNELRVAPEESPVIITEPTLNPYVSREKMTQVMFESFGVPALYLGSQSVLALYAFGRTTGLSIDSGAGSTCIAPVLDGHTLTNAVKTFNVGGSDLTDYLGSLLNVRGSSFTTSAEREILRHIKETTCCLARNYQKALAMASSSQTLERAYALPDGEILIINAERFQCPEALFQPHLMGIDDKGLHEFVLDSVNMCDSALRTDLLNNIVLSGGNTMFPGLPQRLQKEVSKLSSTKARVIAPPERKHAAWLGASILSSQANFLDMCVSKDMYDEIGPEIIHAKCPR